MAKCEFIGTTNRGKENWGDWRGLDNITDKIVKYCRMAFKNKYKDMWIDPVYFDDKYLRHIEYFFAEVGVELYPKITDLREEFKRLGIKYPSTEKEWDNCRSIVWGIVQSDIAANIRKGVKPVKVKVKGVRYSVKGKFKQDIKSVRKVSYL